ncbi:DUF454 domain-containing protein [Natronospirillum operosum]|uniref:Inner membrane protein n=1 Tax=Natronospirillum operosum TaxID=2759953 RepID=A0A4Z0WEQ9_9GAMM|nr:YbaN family protein [Natronospirillum operosum]TGG92806.1 DUF454 domain-containing protein [Natronospirillum operosum]
MTRLLYLGLAYLCTAIGAVGVVMPLLPTTPFLLVAVWAGFRGSPRLARRILRNRQFGPIIRAWHRERAIPLHAKWVACGLLAASWVTLWLIGTRWEVMSFLTLFFTGVATFLLTRANPAGKSA